jgi:hypothetical protein
VLLSGAIVAEMLSPSMLIAATTSEILVTSEQSLAFPEDSEPLLLAGWGGVWRALGVIFGGIATSLSIAQGVQALTPDMCPSSNGEFPISNYNIWYGHYDGYALGLSNQGYLAVGYPDGTIKTTRNIYQGDRNKWFTLNGTPYSFCINGADNLVRARFEP